MKNLVIYHDNCADGYGAAFVAWTKLRDTAEYLPMKYDNLPNADEFLTLIRNREVYVLDFSFPKPMMDALFAHSSNAVWLDHHKTAFEMWCNGIPSPREIYRDCTSSATIQLDNNKSGAYLAWEYFHPNTEVPMLIQHIDDYDRWQFKFHNTKAINKAIWSYAPWSFTQWNVWLNDWNSMHGNDMALEGLAILRAHSQNVQAIVNGTTRPCIIEIGLAGYAPCKYRGLAANCPPHLASDVGHELATKTGTFGLLWYITDKGKCSCSLRSNSDYDVSTIAKAFGGGGHKNAAGFEVDIQALLGWIV